MKNIKLIKTEEDYDLALKRIDVLFDAEPNTPKGDELELLTTLVEIYEKGKYPISNSSLSGKRTLSLNMIRRLNEGLGIPAEVLIQPYGDEAEKIA
jgi:HTH-type transcriptional regulator/antitoxin HigA